jgi:hypothetical protein
MVLQVMVGLVELVAVAERVQQAHKDMPITTVVQVVQVWPFLSTPQLVW